MIVYMNGRNATSETVEVAVSDLRAKLSDYLEIAGRGGTVVVTSRGKPVARLVAPEASKRVPWGELRGKIWMSPDFDEPDEGLFDIMENGPI